MVTFVELTRYARARELSEDTRARIEKDVETWREAVYQAVDRKRARRARWFPRSVTRVVTDLLADRGGRGRVAERRGRRGRLRSRSGRAGAASAPRAAA